MDANRDGKAPILPPPWPLLAGSISLRNTRSTGGETEAAAATKVQAVSRGAAARRAAAATAAAPAKVLENASVQLRNSTSGVKLRFQYTAPPTRAISRAGTPSGAG